MKRNTILLISALLLGTGITASAQSFPTSGEWAGTYTVTSEISVALTGDVVMTGNVIIGTGGKLTITNATDGPVTISNGVEDVRYSAFFETTSTGELVVSGSEGKEIIMDGGAGYTPTFDANGYMEALPQPPTAGGYFHDKALFVNAGRKIELNYVHIKDVGTNLRSSESYDGGAFRHLKGASALNHCKIYECQAQIGAAIFITHGSTGTLSAADCEIYNCYSRGTSAFGGVIRSIGNSSVAATFTNVSIHHNATRGTEARGGGILFNGAQTDAKCELQGCEVYMNYATGGGGGIMGSGNVLFTSSVTKVHDNYSAISGGGVYLEMYGGGAAPASVVTVNQELSQYLEVYENTAPVGGGVTIGIHDKTYTVSSARKEPSLVSGSKYNVIISGASIHDNTATGSSGKGGGLLYINQYDNSAGKYTFTTTFSDGKVYQNTSNRYGGGVYIQGSPLFLITGGEIYSNKTTNGPGGGAYLNSSDVSFANGVVRNNTASTMGGGMYVNNANLTVNGGTFKENTAGTDGGGVYVNGGDVKIESGSIGSNTSTGGAGGGLYVNGGQVTLSGGSVSSNVSKNNGGGIYVNGEVTLDNGTVSGNMAGNFSASPSVESYGGGIYVASGDLKVNGGLVDSNEAAFGGGLSIADGILTITDGTVSNNTAELGGGIYINNTSSVAKVNGGLIDSNKAVLSSSSSYGNGGGIRIYKGTMTVKGGIISNNTSASDGAGIFVSGTGASLSVSDGKILTNTATGDGGGVYLKDKTSFTMTGGSINSNKAVNGAGVRTDGTFNFSDGSIISNVASGNGGGFYATGATVNFSNGSLMSNTAVDGGGIYLDNGTQMTYTNGGLICYNGASHRGGGVYLKKSGDSSHPTYLNFIASSVEGEELGLYSNTADLDATDGAGDDILAEGGTTKVVVPDISAMKLDGYSAKGVTLRWYEDYADNDSAYHSEGTNVNASGDARRYRPQRDALNPIFFIEDIATADPNPYQSKYLALTMGFEFKSLAIRRKGLCPGEQAIYEITRKDEGGNIVYRQRVVIYGTDATWDGINLNVKGIAEGEYTVTETSWAWYNTNEAGSITGPLTQTVTETQGTLFSFINFHPATTDSATPVHDEKAKVNKLTAKTVKTEDDGVTVNEYDNGTGKKITF